MKIERAFNRANNVCFRKRRRVPDAGGGLVPGSCLRGAALSSNWNLQRQQLVEVGLIGREGMTGLPVVLGNDRNSNDVFVQAAGDGQCIRANDLRKAIEKSVTLHRSLLRYAHSFLEQTTRTAVANGRSKIEERLARWLLMADDRLDGSDLPLTHEFLAMMLGVRRPGVTTAMQELEREGVIARRRGSIVILDRQALEKLSNGTYVKADYR